MILIKENVKEIMISKLESVHSFTVMPKDCNFNRNPSSGKNDILFGGKLLYEIDYLTEIVDPKYITIL